MWTNRNLGVQNLLNAVQAADSAGVGHAVGKLVKDGPNSSLSLTVVAILFLFLAATLQHSLRYFF